MSLQTSEPVIVMMKVIKTSCRAYIGIMHLLRVKRGLLPVVVPGGGLAVHSAYDKLITPMTV